MLDIDPTMTFDAFVVGPANRLASAAARRVAESPGTTYNPLFVYAASGLGKSHLLAAVAHRAGEVNPGGAAVYQTLEGFLDELTKALAEGSQDEMRRRYQNLDILLLDDVQFLTGQTQAQELLLRTVDALTSHSSQVVLASDRPPAEINGLDSRLLSRFSGGLIVDIAPPDYETRVAIVRRKAAERGYELQDGVSDAVGRFAFRNVRELQGALNRLLAIQDLEGRPVSPDDVKRILGAPGEGAEAPAPPADGEAAAETEKPALAAGEEEPWRRTLREVAEEGEAKGLDATSIHRLLDEEVPPENPDAVAAGFRQRMERIEVIRGELRELGDPWPEAASRILSDPERLDEAEALLVSARERMRTFPPVPEGPPLEALGGSISPLAIRAAGRLVVADHPEFNPLFLISRDRDEAVKVLEAAGRAFRGRRSQGQVALVSVSAYSEDFIRAISAGVAGAWRERWWDLDLLLMYGIEELAAMERAQEEFFHLFEALKRRDARVILVSDREPALLQGIDDRLRSRFEGGLMVDLSDQGGQAPGAPAAPAGGTEGAQGGRSGGGGPDVVAPSSSGSGQERASEGFEPFEPAAPVRGGHVPGPGDGAPATPPAPSAPGTRDPSDAGDPPAQAAKAAQGARPGGAGDGRAEPEARPGRWWPSKEKVVWRWPRLEERILEDDS